MRRSAAVLLAILAATVADDDALARHAAARSHAARLHRIQKGEASFYGRKEAGRKTASGAPLDPGRMTAASPTLPLGTRARVTNKETGKSAQVTITDRGPYAKGRILDVTPKAAATLGIDRKDGVAPVEVKPLSVPPDPAPAPAPH